MKKFLIAALIAGLTLAANAGERSPVAHKPVKAAKPVEAKPVKLLFGNGIISKFNGLVLSDLQTADALAKGANDTVADQCYSALITAVQGLQAVNAQAANAPAVSLVTDFQKARMVVNALRVNGPVFTACATLQAQIKQDAVLIPASLAGSILGLLP